MRRCQENDLTKIKCAKSKHNGPNGYVHGCENHLSKNGGYMCVQCCEQKQIDEYFDSLKIVCSPGDNEVICCVHGARKEVPETSYICRFSKSCKSHPVITEDGRKDECILCCMDKQLKLRLYQEEEQKHNERAASEKTRCWGDLLVDCSIHGSPEKNGIVRACEAHYRKRSGRREYMCFECCKKCREK